MGKKAFESIAAVAGGHRLRPRRADRSSRAPHSCARHRRGGRAWQARPVAGGLRCRLRREHRHGPELGTGETEARGIGARAPGSDQQVTPSSAGRPRGREVRPKGCGVVARRRRRRAHGLGCVYQRGPGELLGSGGRRAPRHATPTATKRGTWPRTSWEPSSPTSRAARWAASCRSEVGAHVGPAW